MKPNQVSPELKKFICDGFILIKNSKYEKAHKAELLEKLLSLGAGAGWKPVKITIGALKLFVNHDFKLPKGLERAHIYKRKDSIENLLVGEWTDDNWWDWFEERDYTALSTRFEHRDEKNFASVKKFAIPKKLNLFLGKRVRFVYTENEKTFLRKLAAQQGLI